MVGSTLGGKISDLLRKRAVKLSGGDESKVMPERRISTQVYAFILCAAGTCMYGWFADKGIHVSAVLISSAISKLHSPPPPFLFSVFARASSFSIRCFIT